MLLGICFQFSCGLLMMNVAQEYITDLFLRISDPLIKECLELNTPTQH